MSSTANVHLAPKVLQNLVFTLDTRKYCVLDLVDTGRDKLVDKI